MKPSWKHADHAVAFAVQADGFVDSRIESREESLPTAVGQDDRGRSAEPIVVGCETASHNRRHPEHREEICGDLPHGHQLPETLAQAVVLSGHSKQSEVAEAALLAGPVLKIEPGKRIRLNLVPLLVPFGDDHQPVRIRVRQRFQQNAIDHRKHGCVRPDTKSQCEDRNEGEAGTLPEHPEGVAEILHKGKTVKQPSY